MTAPFGTAAVRVKSNGGGRQRSGDQAPGSAISGVAFWTARPGERPRGHGSIGSTVAAL